MFGANVTLFDSRHQAVSERRFWINILLPLVEREDNRNQMHWLNPVVANGSASSRNFRYPPTGDLPAVGLVGIDLAGHRAAPAGPVRLHEKAPGPRRRDHFGVRRSSGSVLAP
jgi:hypothetical protein